MPPKRYHAYATALGASGVLLIWLGHKINPKRQNGHA